MGKYPTIFLLLFFLLLLFTSPVTGEERVQVRGDTMRILRQEDLMILEGNVFLEYRDLEIRADVMELNTQTKVLMAYGQVTLRQKEQYIECQRLEYHLDEDLSIFFEARASFLDKEREDYLYFTSPLVEGDGEKYQITPGVLTPCDLDRPHIFFRASEVIVYPGDYLIASNVIFYELEGRLPLFYWPLLYLSLEREQDILPQFGYSEERGWFMKLAYHYFSVENDTRGIFYLDYYSRTGIGTGFRHYYLEEGDSEGSFYLYILENREKETGWDYFTANLSHRQLIYDWRTNFITNFHLIPEDRERLQLSLNTATSWDTSRLDYRGEFDGTHRLQTDTWNRTLNSRVNYRLSLPVNSTWNMGVEHRLLEDSEGFFSIFQGDGQLTQRGSAHTLEVLFKRDRPQRYEREAPPRFTALPEVSLTLNPSRLYPFSPTLSRYLNPLAFVGLLGRYREEATDVEGTKLKGEHRYQQTFRPFRPLTINVRQQGQASFYFTLPEIVGPDHAYGVSDSRVRAGLRPIQGLDFSLDYNRRFTQGSTPFSFDRVSDREDIGGALTYSWAKGRSRLSSSYSLLTDTYSDLRWDLTLNPLREVRMEASANYSIEKQSFLGLVASSRLDFDTFKHDLALRVNQDFEIERVDTEFFWDIGEVFEVGFRFRYHPKEQEFRRGEALVVWNLHCRQLSFRYDHVKEEFWIEYSIPAFPGQKATFGRTIDDPFLFDLDLGGIIDG